MAVCTSFRFALEAASVLSQNLVGSGSFHSHSISDHCSSCFFRFGRSKYTMLTCSATKREYNASLVPSHQITGRQATVSISLADSATLIGLGSSARRWRLGGVRAYGLCFSAFDDVARVHEHIRRTKAVTEFRTAQPSAGRGSAPTGGRRTLASISVVVQSAPWLKSVRLRYCSIAGDKLLTHTYPWRIRDSSSDWHLKQTIAV